LPGKNIRLLGGIPLIQYTIRAAKDSRALAGFLVSTDDPAIAEAARAAGAPVPFLRPPELAVDKISIWPAVRHATEFWERQEGRKAGVVTLLQPTSPLRTGADIDACIEHFWAVKAEVCVTVSIPHDSPYFNMVEVTPETEPYARALSNTMREISRRQDALPVYALNGAVYVIRRDILDKMEDPCCAERLAVYEMPRSRSVDLDTEDDFALAQFWLSRSGGAS
jgi:CMP-N-acetylneuraminic acid synthetase